MTSNTSAIPNSDVKASLGPKPPRSQAGAAVSVTTASAIGKGLALARNILLVAVLGITGSVADAFNNGNSLPNFAFTFIVSGALGVVLMPTIIALTRKPDGEAKLQKLLTLTVVAIGSITVILVLATPLLIRMFAMSGAWDQRTLDLATAFGIWAIPQVFFYSLHAVIAQLLNSRQQFAVAEWAIATNSLFTVVGLALFLFVFGSASQNPAIAESWTYQQTVILSSIVTLGTVIQLVVVLVALRRGGFPWKWRWGVRGLGLRKASRLVGWSVGASIVLALQDVFLRNITSAAGQIASSEAAIAAGNATFYNVAAMINFPLAIAVVPLLTVLFPRITAAIADRDYTNAQSAFSTALRFSEIFTVFFTVFFIVLAIPILRTLFPTLAPIEVTLSVLVLRLFAIGLVAAGFWVVFIRTMYAGNDGKGVFLLHLWQVFTTVVLTALAVLLVPSQYWAAASALSWSIGWSLAVVFGLKRIGKSIGVFPKRELLPLTGKAIVAAVAAALIGIFISSHVLALTATSTWFQSVTALLLGGASMLTVYVVVLFLLRCPEANQIGSFAITWLKRRVLHR